MLNSNTTDLHDNLINDKYIKHGDLYAYELQKQSLKYLKHICYLFFKRTFDIIFSLAALILLSPIFLFIAVLVRLDGNDSSIYCHKRVGKDNKPFFIYKFRTMKRFDINNLKSILTPKQLEQYYREYKIDNDPRVTRLGKILRKTSLDELPQFFNILKGDMSLIGPRPVLEEEAQKYGDKRNLFVSVRPGLTGYWQANGRNNIEYDTRIQMELYYAENASFILDIKILFKTIKSVISQEGAQ